MRNTDNKRCMQWCANVICSRMRIFLPLILLTAAFCRPKRQNADECRPDFLNTRDAKHELTIYPHNGLPYIIEYPSMDDTEVFQPGASDSALLENAQRFYTKFAENRHKLHFSLAESKRIIVPYTKNIFPRNTGDK